MWRCCSLTFYLYLSSDLEQSRREFKIRSGVTATYEVDGLFEQVIKGAMGNEGKEGKGRESFVNGREISSKSMNEKGKNVSEETYKSGNYQVCTSGSMGSNELAKLSDPLGVPNRTPET